MPPESSLNVEFEEGTRFFARWDRDVPMTGKR
jgi:hypothetical protein